MAKNKNHWYDGCFYDIIIAPNQDKLFSQIKDLVGSQSSVLDIGCGTGRLEFFLSDKCKSLVGIDLSERNIARAKQMLLNHPSGKISFQHSNIDEIINSGNKNFDFAILTYVIHEVNEEERLDLLKKAVHVADRVIIGDYLVPRPDGFAGFLSEVIEIIAGKEHYRNFKSYMSNGGIKYLAKQAGLKIIKEISNHPLTNHIVILEK
jgi:SAM-dependent methyltransferase